MDEEDENSMSPPKAFTPRKAAKRRSSVEESSPDIYGKKTKHGSSGEESALEASFEAPVLEQDMFEAPVLEQDIFEAPVLEQDIFEAPVLEQDIFEAPVLEQDIFESLPGPSHRKTRSLDYQYQQVMPVQKLEQMVSNSLSISHIPSAMQTRFPQPHSSTTSSFTLHSNVQVVNEGMDTSERGDEFSNQIYLTGLVKGRIYVRQPVYKASPVDIYPDGTSARCANAYCNKSLSRKWAVTCETNDQHVYCMVCMMSYYNTHSKPYYCPSGQRCFARDFPAPWQSSHIHERFVTLGYNQNN